jgi:hypothetical protein
MFSIYALTMLYVEEIISRHRQTSFWLIPMGAVDVCIGRELDELNKVL